MTQSNATFSMQVCAEITSDILCLFHMLQGNGRVWELETEQARKRKQLIEQNPNPFASRMTGVLWTLQFNAFSYLNWSQDQRVCLLLFSFFPLSFLQWTLFNSSRTRGTPQIAYFFEYVISYPLLGNKGRIEVSNQMKTLGKQLQTWCLPSFLPICNLFILHKTPLTNPMSKT